jgi:hypothetical protein
MFTTKSHSNSLMAADCSHWTSRALPARKDGVMVTLLQGMGLGLAALSILSVWPLT